MLLYKVACSLVGAVIVRATTPSPDPALVANDIFSDWEPPQLDYLESTGQGLRRVVWPGPRQTAPVTTELPTHHSGGDATDDQTRRQRYTEPQTGRYSTRREDAGAFVASRSVPLNAESIQLSPGSVVPLEMESGTNRVCSMCLRQVSLGGNFALACNQHAVHSCMKRLHDAAQSKNKSLRCPLCPSERQSNPVIPPIAPKNTLSGTFSGMTLEGRLRMTATFSSISVDLVFNLDGRDCYSGKGIPYTMDGLSVKLIDGPSRRRLLDQYVLGSEFLSMKYDPSADEISCSHRHLLITATRVV